MRTRFLVCAIACLGLCAGPAWAEEPSREKLRVRVQAVRVSDDDGSRPADVTPSEFRQWIDFTNNCFRDAGIEFVFDPDDGDFCELKSTVVNNLTSDIHSNERKAAMAAARRWPGKLVVILRHGPGEHPTGQGFSWWDHDFVAAPGFGGASHCGHPHYDLLAHEVGHYLGLAHTFAADSHETVQQAEDFFVKGGCKPEVFDGDGFSDTPPDPLIRPLECERTGQITLKGVQFVLPRRNLMSYYDERDSLSPQQIERVRWTLRKRMEGSMRMPSNTGLESPIEAESLRVIATRKCACSVQPMGGFGVDRWSGDAQLFCGAEDGGWFEVAFQVPTAQRARLCLYATLAPDFGTCRFVLDGKRLSKQFDAYAPMVIPSGRIVLTEDSLSAGDHSLRIEITGKNALSSRWSLGVDCLTLEPVALAE